MIFARLFDCTSYHRPPFAEAYSDAADRHAQRQRAECEERMRLLQRVSTRGMSQVCTMQTDRDKGWIDYFWFLRAGFCDSKCFNFLFFNVVHQSIVILVILSFLFIWVCLKFSAHAQAAQQRHRQTIAHEEAALAGIVESQMPACNQ